MADRIPLVVDSSSQQIKELPAGDSLILSDSEKVILGTGSDLQIYHDGSNSYINETGTGDLYIKCNDEIRIQGQDDANLIYAQQDGSVGLYYNGTNKFSTTNTGATVAGLLTATTSAGADSFD